jgi:hypothetical protein
MPDQTTPSVWDTYDWDQPFDLETFPLDRPELWGMTDWGGDGSDPHRPRRDHVLAALVPTDEPYPPPVEALRTLGKPTPAQEQQPYPNLTQEHVPDLVRMARDRALSTAPGNSDDVWAPIHAVYALAHLDVTNVVEDLIPLLDTDTKWYDQTLKSILASPGAAAMEPLCRYVDDSSRWVYGRWYAADALAQIGEQSPSLRKEVVAFLSTTLQAAEEQEPILNAAIIETLHQLSATEAMPIIRRAFELDAVDEMVMGDWATVADEFGVELTPGDPLVEKSARRWDETREKLFPNLKKSQFLKDMRESLDADSIPPALRQPPPPPPREKGKGSQKTEQAKRKQKRKQQAASRKANKGSKKRK